MNKDVKHCNRCGQFYIKSCGAECIPSAPPTPPPDHIIKPSKGLRILHMVVWVLFVAAYAFLFVTALYSRL